MVKLVNWSGAVRVYQYSQTCQSMWTNSRIELHTKVCEIWGSHGGIPKI